MKRKSTLYAVVGIFIIAIVTLSMTIVINLVMNYFFNKRMEQSYDQIQREFALTELAELKGRTREIEYLSWSYACNTPEMKIKLNEHLEDIIKFENNENKYLKDLQISINNYNDDIDAVCEEIILQIDEKIKELRVLR